MENAILDFINKLEKSEVPMHAVLLMQKGRLITEGYYAPYKKDTLHRMFSIVKSLNALCIGLLEEEGKLQLTDKIVNYFPDMLPDEVHPFLAAMTIEDMLRMRSCHAQTTYKSSDMEWVESFFKTPPTHKPGTVFHYDTSAAHVLCMLVERVSKKPMFTYFREKIADEIGWSKEAYLIENDFGDPQGGSGLMCTPKDLLLLAKLLIQDGNWEGKQLLPKEYLKKATSNLTPNIVTGGVRSERMGYGYQIWCGEHGSFVLYGMGGQLAICFPQYDFICVTCADSQGMGGGNQFIYNALHETILPALQEEKLLTEETPAITECLKKLRIAPICDKAIVSPVAKHIIGRTITFAPNTSGFTHGHFTFTEDYTEGTFHYSYGDKDCSLPFSLTACKEGRFPVYDMFCATSAAWLAEDTLYIKSHIIDSSVGSVHMEFVFGDNDMTVFIKKIEETIFNEYNCHLYGSYS